MPNEIVKFIRKANDLVEARYKFDIWETRLFTKMLTMVHRDDEEFKEYRIYIKDIIREFDLVRNKESYELLRQGARKLMKKTFLIPYESKTGQKRLFETPVIASLDSASNDGIRGTGEELYVQVSFHPKLKPYILQLKNQFTLYDVRNILRLPSNYSVRIYELLKQYESIGRRRFEVQELKEILGVEKEYPLYANFKQRVLKKAQKDLEAHTDIHFIMDEVKRGRAVTELLFTIMPNSAMRNETGARRVGKTPVPIVEPEAPMTQDEALFSEIFPQVRQYVRESVVRAWVRELPAEQIRRGVRYVLAQLKKGAAIENPAGYLQTMVRQPLENQTPDPIETEREKREARREQERLRTQMKEELSARFAEIQNARLARLQAIVQQVFDENPDFKVEIVEETRLDETATPSESEYLFDTYYSKAASFRAMVNNKVMTRMPERFGELATFDEDIRQVKLQLGRL